MAIRMIDLQDVYMRTRYFSLSVLASSLLALGAMSHIVADHESDAASLILRANSPKAVDMVPPVKLTVDRIDEQVRLRPDGTYSARYTEDYHVNSKDLLREEQVADSFSFYPDEQKVKLLSGSVTTPNGEVHEIKPSDVYLTSKKEKEYPSIDVAKVMKVALPSLRAGSKVHLVWGYEQIKPSIFPFADAISAPSKYLTMLTRYTLVVPKGTKLRLAHTGPFRVTKKKVGDERIIHAEMGPMPAVKEEPFMQAASDFRPYFEVSTAKSWDELGKVAWEKMQDSQRVTPKVKALVDKITRGAKTEQEGIQALYNWVATNIDYLNTTHNTLQGHVPTSAEQILREGYGDCKDHASLFQTFLKAYGVDAQAVFANWDDSFEVKALPIISFNHQLVYIPKYKKYANPTNGTQALFSPLEQTNFNSEHLQVHVEKPALIADGDRSHLTKLPTPIANKHRFYDDVHIVMDPQYEMYVAGDMRGTGIFDTNLRGRFEDKDKDFAAEVLAQNGISGKGVFGLKNIHNLNKRANIKYRWHAYNAVDRDDKDGYSFTIPEGVNFYTPAFFSQYTILAQRAYPLVAVKGILDWDYQIDIPKGLQFAEVPHDIVIKNNAGEFSSHYYLNKEKNRLFAKRHLYLAKLRYPVKDYAALQHVLQQYDVDARQLLKVEHPMNDKPKA